MAPTFNTPATHIAPGDVAALRADFMTEALRLGYWNETEVINSLRHLGYKGIPVLEPRRSVAMQRLSQYLAHLNALTRETNHG